MSKAKDWLAEKLFEQNLISNEQFISIKAWRSLGIFSLHNEILFLLYLAVLLFTTGIGIAIYDNIDSIGHMAILATVLILSVGCFYFAFRNAPAYSNDETKFGSPVFNYVVLLGTLLSCIFITYLQVQYEVFGDDYSLSALGCAIVGFAAAYYFDNSAALSVAITALATFVGITVTPEAVIKNAVYTDPAQTYFGILLAVLLIAWTEYAVRNQIKKHFSFIYLTFALHLLGICCIKGLFEDVWPLFLFVMAAGGYYFYKRSYEIPAVSIFVFTLVYGYIGVNILIGRMLEFVGLFEIMSVVTFAFPVYFVLSILLFIKMIRQFNRATDDGQE